jgi:hypothetical protein
MVFRALLHSVTLIAGGAEAGRERAEMSQDFAHGRGAIAAATTEQREVAV